MYEQRIWSPYRQDAQGNSVFFYGTEGMMTLGQTGIQVYGGGNKLIKSEKLDSPQDAHQRDFLDAIKSGNRPNADIEVGHLSSTLCHLGNIVARTRRAVKFDPKAERIDGDHEADKLIRREYRDGHWAVPT